MLSGSILTSNSTLNNFQEIGGLEIFRGEEIILQFRIKDRQTGSRYVPASGAVITITLNDGDTGLIKTGVMNVDDRSMVSVTLSEADTESILSGDINFDVVEGTVTKKGQIVDGIRMLNEGC